ncbi:MAG: hypothetical protein H6707_21750 [Deltaproteobacteria bacterium]|nr:hypothetical protein [Deltaproteobacteria bacterium]
MTLLTVVSSASAVLISLTAWGKGPAVFAPITQPLTNAGFEQIANRDGIRVYKHRTATLIHLGAEAYLPYPPERVWRGLIDYRAHVSQMQRLSEARVLWQQAESQQLLVYQRLNLPVISDRDYVLHVRWGKRDDVLWVAYRVVQGFGPARVPGVVRVPQHEGVWQLRRAKDGRGSQVRYQMRIDLAGYLPRWLARSGAGKEVPELFEAICRIVRHNGGKEKCMPKSS